MIYFNRIKDVEIALPDIRAQFDGIYRYEAFQGVEFPRGSGNVFEIAGTRRVVGFGDNIVTNTGLENYGAGVDDNNVPVAGKFYQGNYGHVGTGTAAESATDTSLTTFVASALWDLPGGSVWAQGSPPYYGNFRYKYRFSPNFGGGNVILNEVATSFQAANGNISSRALTKDGNGDPSSLPVLQTEYLDVFYIRRNYPAHITEGTGVPTDTTGTIDVSGTSYGYTIRPAAVTNLDWGQECMFGFQPKNGFGSTDFATAYGSDAVMGAVTANGPSTALQTFGTTTRGVGSYTLGTYNRNTFYTFDIDQGNVSGGIKGLVVRSSFGAYQMIFDTVIPKDNTKVFTYYHNWAWTRKTLP